ncbi:SRPBCC family protein [Demequina globuliformis]|uniref:SRPBCC family protein n=1 Tax=Demequina globuliformis TaxID=676202 RepID=UPI000783BDC8|nr:SRPBCC family protein [Demequina globuliformis]
MPALTIECDFTMPLDAAVEDVWAFIDSPEAQVRHHPQIDRIDVVTGAWGEPGSEFVTSGRGKDGEPFTVQQRLVAVDRPHSYVTELKAPDLTTTSTIRFDVVDGRVASFSQGITAVTRNLSLAEYGLVKLQSGAVKREAGDDFLVSLSVLQRFLIEECGDGADAARAG